MPLSVEKSASAGSVNTNSTKTKGPKSANVHRIDRTKSEKIKIDKPKTDSNGGGTAAPKTPPIQTEKDQKAKSKKFGEDYVEAPPPSVNPWKKSHSSNPGCPSESDPTPSAAAPQQSQTVRNKEVKEMKASVSVGKS